MQLSPGAFLGETLSSRDFSGFSVSETRYAPSARFPRHDHELASICVVRRGAYDETYGRETLSFSAGDVVAHPAGDHHANVHAPSEVRLTIIEFSATWLDALRSRVNVLGERASARADGALATLGSRLAREAAADDAVAGLACEGVILDMLATIARAPAPRVTGRTPWLDRVEAALREDERVWSTADLAALAGVHPSYLARVFRERHGCSPGEFRRRAMVEEARRRIVHTADPLSRIAVDCGFSDQSHMTRCFAAVLNVTPGQYRRRYPLG
jgi:AraC family transcriptional regulator